jgi:hypothetical protein
MVDAKRPKVREHPESRKIKVGADPASFDAQTIAWHFHRLDDPHVDWGWNIQPTDWREVLRQLRAFEGLTWAKIQEQAGGRSHGSNSHMLDVSALSTNAQRRLVELKLDEYDSVFSLRMSNTLRLYGIRDGRVLQLLWRDPHHGTRRGACPTTK